MALFLSLRMGVMRNFDQIQGQREQLLYRFMEKKFLTERLRLFFGKLP